MTKINEVIPPMPDAPDSTTDTKTEFNVKADTFVKAWTPHTTSINTWATEANAVATEINSVVASLPTGTIDDVNLSTTSAFSNQYVHDTYVPKTDYVIPPELQAHIDDGNPFPSWNGASYTLGGRANEEIYPDGTIKGSHGNIYWTMSPNGELEVRQQKTSAFISCTNAAGNIFYGSAQCTFDTNAPSFIILDSIQVIGTPAGDSSAPASANSGTTFGEPFDIKVTGFYVAGTSWSTGGQAYIGYVAKGLWK